MTCPSSLSGLCPACWRLRGTAKSLLQDSAEPPVFVHFSLGLTCGAVLERPRPHPNLADGIAAHRTRLSCPGMNAVVRLLVLLEGGCGDSGGTRDGFVQNLVHSGKECVRLFVGHGCCLEER